jgi:hypothetical protein
MFDIVLGKSPARWPVWQNAQFLLMLNQALHRAGLLPLYTYMNIFKKEEIVKNEYRPLCKPIVREVCK